jgi:hypothetical protein
MKPSWTAPKTTFTAFWAWIHAHSFETRSVANNGAVVPAAVAPRRRGQPRDYQPNEPGSPLIGPTIFDVTQPP